MNEKTNNDLENSNFKLQQENDHKFDQEKEQENKTPSQMARLAWPKAKYGVIIAIIIFVVINLLYYNSIFLIDMAAKFSVLRRTVVSFNFYL